MPKPQYPLKEPSQANTPTTHSNHVSLQSHSLLLSDSCDTNFGQASIPLQSVNQTQLTQPPFPHLLINPHVASVLHAQTPPSPQGDNHTQPPLPLSPSREMLMNDNNQLQDLSNLLAMHLSQSNTPTSPYSLNLPHTLNLDQVEQHVGYYPIILRECMEKAQAKSSLAKLKIDNNVKIELSKEHLKELRNNGYSGTTEEDVGDHIAKVLEISNLIKTLNMDTDRLRVYVFPFLLTSAARMWWINEGSDKTTTWSEVVGRFFCKYYPLSRAGKYDVTRDDEDEEDNYLEFIIWLNSKCKDHKSMNETTKSALWHYWLKEEGNNELMDDTKSSDEELKEPNCGNPRNTNVDSFFKPYLDA
ncbi:hypothetical protein Tco_1232145 [Tanacetum coccineum]